MKKQIISTKKAPEAIGPYSQAIKVGDTLFISGQIALDPEKMAISSDSIEGQTVQVMQNLEEILKAAKMGFINVVKTTCYLSDMSDFGVFNQIYGEYFTDNPPARATIAVKSLPKNVLVEVDAVAVDF